MDRKEGMRGGKQKRETRLRDRQKVGGREGGKIKGKARRGLVLYRQAGIKGKQREVLVVSWLFGCCPLSKIDSMITYQG